MCLLTDNSSKTVINMLPSWDPSPRPNILRIGHVQNNITVDSVVIYPQSERTQLPSLLSCYFGHIDREIK